MPALKEEQLRTLRGLYDAARRLDRELLVEIIAAKHGPLADDTTARALGEIYAAGIKPDWWKLEPQASRRRMERGRAGHRARTIPGAAASCCSALKRRRSELKAAFARRCRRHRSSRALPSAGRFSPTRRGPGSPAGSMTTRRGGRHGRALPAARAASGRMRAATKAA